MDNSEVSKQVHNETPPGRHNTKVCEADARVAIATSTSALSW